VRRLLAFLALLIGSSCDGLGCMPPSWGASALLHPARRPVEVAPKIPFRQLNVKNGDVELRGWAFPARGTTRGAIVYLHGSGDNRVSGLGIAERFTATGFEVIAYDSRAHGASTGEHCTYGFYEKGDLKRVLDTVTQRPIVLFGTSLGAAVALQAAAEDPRISGVIGVATFSDLRTVAEERAPPFAGSANVAEAFRIAERQAAFRVADVSPVRAAERIHVPVLLIHGEQDRDTPPSHSQRVHAALRGDKRLILAAESGHFNVITPSIWAEIDAWLTTVAPPPR